jgi:hypothetical protein
VRKSNRNRHFKLSQAAFGVTAGFISFGAPYGARGIVIRHDVPESSYTGLAADPKYAAVGALTFGDITAGTLISPKWVLTAGHVANSAGGFTFLIGGASVSDPANQSITDVQHFANPAFAGSGTAGTDMGLIRLSSSVANIVPASRYFGSNELGNEAVWVGYGQGGVGNDPARTPKGTRRAAQNVIDVNGTAANWDPRVLLSDFDDPGNVDGINFLGTADPQPLEGIIADGDSGSGVFIDVGGRARLAAVTSFKSATDGTANSSYSDIGGDTKVSAHNQWIDDNIVHYWNSNSSGSFTTAANWDLGPTAIHAVPGAGDILGLKQAGTYTITFGGSTNLHQILARGGTVMLAMGSFAHSITSTMLEGGITVGRYSGENASLAFVHTGSIATNGAVSISGDINIAEQPGSTGRLIIGANGKYFVTRKVYVGGTVDGPGGSGILDVGMNGPSQLVANDGIKIYGNATVNFGLSANSQLSAGPLLDISSGGRLNLLPGIDLTVLARDVNLEGTARIDLNRGNLLANYDVGSPSPLPKLRSYIAAGYNGGNWQGNGITSTAAAASPLGFGHTALGYGEAGVLGITSFKGYSADSTTALIKYTYVGDATLDGKVDVGDLGRLATAWQTSGPWTDGDFDYNGTVNVNDLGLLATNWQAGIPIPLGPSFEEALASLGLPSVSVPEPTGVLIAMPFVWAFARRRRDVASLPRD